MKLRKLANYLLLLALLLASSLLAQVVLSPSSSIDQFRKIGEKRIWTFEIDGKRVGRLVSQVVDRTTINGIDGYRINQRFTLTKKVGEEDQTTRIIGDYFLSKEGFYLGDSKEVGYGDNIEKLEVELDGTTLKGFFTRGGKKIEQSLEIPENIKPLGNNFFDQYEYFLASQEIFIGRSFDLEMFDPISLTINNFVAIVDNFAFMPVHSKLNDSLFIIKVTSPQEMTLYFSSKKKLQKIDIPQSKTKVYLDLVKSLDSPQTKSGGDSNRSNIQKPGFSLKKSILLIPKYIVYLIFSILVLLMFLGNGYKWKITYGAFGFGILAFVLIPYVQYPIQSYFVNQFIIPAMKSGDFGYSHGIMPSLAGGLIQEMLLFFVLLGTVTLSKEKSYKFVAIGGAIGAGLGFAESSYLTTMLGTIDIFSLLMLEKLGFIALHCSLGALLGWGLSKEKSALIKTIVAAVVANSIMRYLPLFAQMGIFDAEVLSIFTAVTSTIIATVVLFTLKKN